MFIVVVASFQVITGFAVSRVVKSDNPAFKVGEYVSGFTSWEEYHLSKGGQSLLLEPVPYKDLPLSYNLGVLGECCPGVCPRVHHVQSARGH